MQERMYPLILIAKQEESIETFLTSYRQEHAISESYVYSIHPAKTEFTIDQVRELKKELFTETKHKRLIILHSFDKANTEAQNALLKTLEEKNNSNQFILISPTLERILPTIRSRSQVINLNEDSPLVRQETKLLVDEIIKKPSCVFLAHPLVQGISKEDGIVLLEEILTILRSYYASNNNSSIVVKNVLQIMAQLRSNNLNPQLAVDYALLSLRQK